MVSGELPAFGMVLKRYRLLAGLTHEALAERSALSARAISDLERGVTRAPRRQTLALLADALQLTPDQRRMLETAARPGALLDGRVGPRHNLPAQLTSFVGREHEIHAVRDLLRRQDTRLVTLTGPGGAGKTRLALRVGEDLLGEFPDGTFFVPLAPVAEPGVVIEAVAQALGVAKPAGDSLEAAVAGYLRRRQVLLVLDNFEHLLAGAPLLARLLGSCPGMKLLITSRAALRLSGEQEFPVAPLPVPDLRRLPPVEALSRYAAVALFVERAARVRPDFRLTPANAGSVAAICVRLDGLPLALELAAARTKLLPPGALLPRLERPGGALLRVLTGGARDLPPRQQTLRDTIAWSYDLLSPDEQRLFRRLAVFVGGCNLDAAEAVCGCPPGREESRDLPDLGIDVLDGLASLMDNSLLRREEGPAPPAGGAQPRPAGGLEGSPPYEEEPRFEMLETIREFALEQLAGTSEAAAVRARHSRYFLDMVERSGPALVGTARHPFRLAAEQENIRTALRRLVESG